MRQRKGLDAAPYAVLKAYMRKPIRELRAAPKEINVVDGFNTDEDNEVSTDTDDVEAPEFKTPWYYIAKLPEVSQLKMATEEP